MSDIAIVGMDCRFPHAPNPAALWQLLLTGAEGIGEVPDNRWPAADFFDPDGGPGKMNTRSGGFLADADAFDHEFFAIPAREAHAMDPQQRLLLQTAWRALEDSTLDPRSQAGSRTGVFVGVMANEWAHVQMRDYAAITPQLGVGNGYFMTANRLSYQLDLNGPSMAVDTACSSSLAAVHLACQVLRAGECDQALAAGVNMILTPAINVFYSQAGLSAPDGRCKPFSGEANGIGRGEGVGVLVLRRLGDAEGLPIYAVIKAVAVNADGRSNGIAAPNRWSQQAVITESYRRAGVDPAEIAFVEAHGTGTVLGDMIEVKALGDVHGVPRPEPCAIGSIKDNLGHTEGAAGIAGLIKVALALHHGVVPPSRYADAENVRLRLAENGLRLLTEPLELPADRNYAAVSSFGLGGTNAHVLLASAPTSAPPPSCPGGGVLTFSSATRDGLRRNAAALAQDLAARPSAQLAQWCWTSNRVKASGRHRVAIPVREPDEAVAALRAAATDEASLDAWSGVARAGVATGWMFTGQGSQYPRMSRALHESSGSYRRALAEVDEAMTPELGVSVRELMFGDDEAIHQTGCAQPAIFAVQYALSKVLTDAGIQPAWLLGHSVGEYAAAAVAGVFDLDDACQLIAARGRFMQALPGGGGMLGVRSGPAEVSDLAADRRADGSDPGLRPDGPRRVRPEASHREHHPQAPCPPADPGTPHAAGTTRRRPVQPSLRGQAHRRARSPTSRIGPLVTLLSTRSLSKPPSPPSPLRHGHLRDALPQFGAHLISLRIGKAAEAFHLVHGQDHRLVRRRGLDLVGEGEGFLQLGPDLDAGADLLGEHLVARDAVLGEDVELRLEFLGEHRAPGVPDADVGGRGVRREGERDGGAGAPRLAGPAVGRGGHAQELGEPGHLGEAAGVVGAGDRVGARPAWRAGVGLAARAGVALDVVGIARGSLLRDRHAHGCCHKRFSEVPRIHLRVRTSSANRTGGRDLCTILFDLAPGKDRL
jgi:3-oxoacyl-(acyl-carrier-protein) synthase